MHNDAKRIIFLQGKKTILRPLNIDTDLENITRWINDPEVRQFVKNGYPQTLLGERKWIENKDSNKNDITLAIETQEGRHIGLMGLHTIDYRNRVAATGALIGEKDCWKQGYGSDAKMALLNYAFNTLNLHRINSAVIGFNERSLCYSLKCGYCIEGVQRGALYQDGKYHNKILLGLLKEDWLLLWKEYQASGTFAHWELAKELTLRF